MTDERIDGGVPGVAPPDPRLLSIEIRDEHPQLVLVLHGEADVLTDPLLADAIVRAGIDQRSRVVLDLAALTFIDAYTIDLIVASARSLREHGLDLVVRSPRPLARRLLVMLGLSALIDDLGSPRVAGGAA